MTSPQVSVTRATGILALRITNCLWRPQVGGTIKQYARDSVDEHRQPGELTLRYIPNVWAVQGKQTWQCMMRCITCTFPRSSGRRHSAATARSSILAIAGRSFGCAMQGERADFKK